jgi:hypothetical protein
MVKSYKMDNASLAILMKKVRDDGDNYNPNMPAFKKHYEVSEAQIRAAHKFGFSTEAIQKAVSNSCCSNLLCRPDQCRHAAIAILDQPNTVVRRELMQRCN